MPIIVLTPIQARVVATLMEKARTVPDSYPMTLNSLVLGCNQKTSRDPILQVDEAQALEALDGLRSAAQVREASGGRVLRYEHNFQRGIGVTPPVASLQCAPPVPATSSMKTPASPGAGPTSRYALRTWPGKSVSNTTTPTA